MIPQRAKELAEQIATEIGRDDYYAKMLSGQRVAPSPQDRPVFVVAGNRDFLFSAIEGQPVPSEYWMVRTMARFESSRSGGPHFLRLRYIVIGVTDTDRRYIARLDPIDADDRKPLRRLNVLIETHAGDPEFQRIGREEVQKELKILESLMLAWSETL